MYIHYTVYSMGQFTFKYCGSRNTIPPPQMHTTNTTISFKKFILSQKRPYMLITFRNFGWICILLNCRVHNFLQLNFVSIILVRKGFKRFHMYNVCSYSPCRTFCRKMRRVLFGNRSFSLTMQRQEKQHRRKLRGKVLRILKCWLPPQLLKHASFTQY